MKKIIHLIILWAFFIALSSSGYSKGEKPNVLATTTFLADLTRNVVGDLAEVSSLMPIGGDPHIYDPVPGDALKIANSDLIFKNGLHLEGWLDEMLENAGNEVSIITLTEGIPIIQSEDHANAYDPHAWMNVRFALIYIENIRTALINFLPGKEAEIQANYNRYRAELVALDQYIEDKINLIPAEKRVLITSHDAFRYYGQRYGMRVESVMGTSTEADIRVEDVQQLVRTIRDLGVPSIFIESTIDPKQLRQLAGDQGIVVGGKLFADSLGDTESGADTYINMLKRNTDLIVQGLTRTGEGRSEKQKTDFFSLLIILSLLLIAFGTVWWLLRSKSGEEIAWKDFDLEMHGVSVSYDKKTALSNVYLKLGSGHVIGLIGSNGSGKSTLMKSILGLVEPDAGEIVINGRDVEDIRKYIAYIPQKEEVDFSFPATVSDVVLMGRYPHRNVFEPLKQIDKQKAAEAMKVLGIDDLKHKQIGELSGGQQQRAFIARALCQGAEIYLFDEPFVGVDVTTESRIMEIVRDLAKQGKMVIIIHHDLAKVKEYFDQVVMINQRIVTAGPTEEVFNDENIAKTYGGQLAMLHKTVAPRK